MPGFEQQPPPLFKQGPAPLALLILYVCASISLLVLDDRFRYLEPLRSGVTEVVSPLKKVVQWPVMPPLEPPANAAWTALLADNTSSFTTFINLKPGRLQFF